MKALLVSCLLSAVPVAAGAQHFELAISGGASVYTPIRQRDFTKEYLRFLPVGKPTATATIRASYNTKHYKLGTSVGTGSIWGHKRYGVPLGVYSMSEYTPYSWKSHFYSNYMPMQHVTYIPVNVFLNRKISFHRAEAYGGVSAGCIKTTGTDQYYLLTDHSDRRRKRDVHYSAGVQAGLTYYAGKRLGINAEAAASYVWLRPAYMVTFPITIGAVCRL